MWPGRGSGSGTNERGTRNAGRAVVGTEDGPAKERIEHLEANMDRVLLILRGVGAQLIAGLPDPELERAPVPPRRP